MQNLTAAILSALTQLPNLLLYHKFELKSNFGGAGEFNKCQILTAHNKIVNLLCKPKGIKNGEDFRPPFVYFAFTFAWRSAVFRARSAAFAALSACRIR